MYIPRPEALSPLNEKFKNNIEYAIGEDDRSAFRLATDYGAQATVTTWIASRGREIMDDLFGEAPDITPEEAKEVYNINIDEAISPERLNTLIQVRGMANYMEMQLQNKDIGIVKRLAATMAGGLLDPALAVLTVGVGSAISAGLKGSAAAVSVLYNSNPFVKWGARAAIYGTEGAGWNIAAGKAFMDQIDEDYGWGDTFVDGAVGMLLGTALSKFSMNAIPEPKQSIYSKAPVTSNVVSEVESKITNPKFLLEYSDVTNKTVKDSLVDTDETIKFFNDFVESGDVPTDINVWSKIFDEPTKGVQAVDFFKKLRGRTEEVLDVLVQTQEFDGDAVMNFYNHLNKRLSDLATDNVSNNTFSVIPNVESDRLIKDNLVDEFMKPSVKEITNKIGLRVVKDLPEDIGNR